MPGFGFKLLIILLIVNGGALFNLLQDREAMVEAYPLMVDWLWTTLVVTHAIALGAVLVMLIRPGRLSFALFSLAYAAMLPAFIQVEYPLPHITSVPAGWGILAYFEWQRRRLAREPKAA